MWADAQRDGRPAEYRWHPLFNAAKFGWRPNTGVPCSNAAKMWNPLKLAGAKLTKRFQPLVCRVHHIVGICGGDIAACLTFFPIVDTCLNCEDIARQSCVTVPGGDFLGFLHPVFSASRTQHVSDLHLKFALRPHHVSKYGRHPICDGWD